jgi:23S rRNA pseudouridine2605 synthase
VQLHRACSKLGWGSRTQAVAWIRGGNICVDGRVVTDPLTWVDLDRQCITRTDEKSDTLPKFSSLRKSDRLVLVLHKPVGIVTTRRDERGRKTVYDLLPADLPWIFPAGRLDADSEGLLILTNDSALAVRLTEPEAHVPKTYHVTIRGVPSEKTLDQLRHGMELLGKRTKPIRLQVIRQNRQTTLVEMILAEGRNRQIRRMWQAVGHRVRRLVRVAIGEYSLGDLRPGEWRMLLAKDIVKLAQAKKEPLTK